MSKMYGEYIKVRDIIGFINIFGWNFHLDILHKNLVIVIIVINIAKFLHVKLSKIIKK